MRVTSSKRVWCLAVGGLLVIVIACFPPIRRSGSWRDVVSGQPVSAATAMELDRSYFGYLPHFDWIGTVGREQDLEPATVVKLEDQGPSACSRYRWAVDGWSLAAEVTIVALLVLAFCGAQRIFFCCERRGV